MRVKLPRKLYDLKYFDLKTDFYIVHVYRTFEHIFAIFSFVSISIGIWNVFNVWRELNLMEFAWLRQSSTVTLYDRLRNDVRNEDNNNNKMIKIKYILVLPALDRMDCLYVCVYDVQCQMCIRYSAYQTTMQPPNV